MITLYQIVLHVLAAIGLAGLCGALFLCTIGAAASALAPRMEEEPEFDTVNFDFATGARKSEFEEPLTDAVFEPVKPPADLYSDLPPAWISPESVEGGAAAGVPVAGRVEAGDPPQAGVSAPGYKPAASAPGFKPAVSAPGYKAATGVNAPGFKPGCNGHDHAADTSPKAVCGEF